MDLSNQDAVMKLYKHWNEIFPGATVTSFRHRKNSTLNPFSIGYLNCFLKLHPILAKTSSPTATNASLQEIIREKILLNYQKEIPYSVEVEVEEFKETEKIINVRCVIHVERDSQKGIIIGHKGQAIKQVGTEARKDAEEFFDKKIFMELYVKVAKDWREKDKQLKNFGYDAI